MESGQAENGDGQESHERDEAEGDDGGDLSEPVLVLDQVVRRQAEHGRHVDG